MKKILFLVLAFPFFAHSQTSDSAVIKQISDEMLRNGKAYDLLYQLTKQIGGRLAGSPAFAKAVQWGKTSLENLGADQVILQECMVPHWVRGGADKATIISINHKETKRELDVVALGNSLGNGTITAPVLAVEDFDELEKRKDEVKGKIVYFNHAFDPRFIKTFQAYGEAVVYRGAGPSRAAKYGAVGVMIRSMTESVANDPHTGGTHYNDAYPKIPAIAVGPRDADYIWELGKYASFTLSMTTNGHFLPDTIGHNVIGILKGSEFPDEIITVGGHLDSWDVNEGAMDDGTGIVQTMEILRTMKALGIHPKHTIHFVLFANEENGLRGGLKYAQEAKKNGEKHIFALESDAGGFTPRGFSLDLNKDQLAKVRSWIPLLAAYGTNEISAGGGGADVGPLGQMLGTPVGELMPDSQRYFDLHHARTDVLENVNKREMLLGAVNMASLLYLIDKYGL